jgi:hypothetical protein
VSRRRHSRAFGFLAPEHQPWVGPGEGLRTASDLAVDLWYLGEYQAARELDKDTLARRRRVLGEDHPDTLISASNLAAYLRALGEADDGP